MALPFQDLENGMVGSPRLPVIRVELLAASCPFSKHDASMCIFLSTNH
jgi:hypothetical protein